MKASRQSDQRPGRALFVGVGLDQAGVDGEAFSTNEPLVQPPAHHDLEEVRRMSLSRNRLPEIKPPNDGITNELGGQPTKSTKSALRGSSVPHQSCLLIGRKDDMTIGINIGLDTTPCESLNLRVTTPFPFLYHCLPDPLEDMFIIDRIAVWLPRLTLFDETWLGLFACR
jgi:hypothetical protein